MSTDPGTPMNERGLAAFSVRHPVTIAVLTLCILVVGGVAGVRMPLQLMPDGLEVPFISVFIPYPNANPAEVEERVLNPLEELLRTVPDIDEINGSARADYLWCGIRFRQNTDMDQAYNDVRDRIERLRATLPDDVDRIWVRRENPNDEPVIEIGTILPSGIEDPWDYIQRNVVRPLERLPGVAKVELNGADEKILRVELDMEKVARHNVDMAQLASTLRRANFTIPAGHVTDGGRKVYVRSMGEISSAAEIAALPVPGTSLHVSDLGKVVYGAPARERFFRINGRDGYVVEVTKESDANAVEVCDAVEREIAAIAARPAMANVGFEPFFSQGDAIVESLNTLRSSGMMGAALALVVLLVFLRRLRVTVLIMVAIPLSVLSTVIVMYFAHMTYNLMTLLGLLVSLGMLVDNAVVVTENITRMFARGGSAKEASIRGAREIALAITLSTMTTVVVFLPTVLLAREAEMKFYLGVMAIPVCTSVLASLVVALTLIPLYASGLLRIQHEPGAFARLCDRAYDLTVGALERQYPKWLDWFMDRRFGMAMLVLLVFMVTVAVPMKKVKSSSSGGNGRTIGMNFSFPGSFTIADASAFYRRVEEVVEQHRNEWGIQAYRVRSSSTWGGMRIFLKPASETDMDVEKLVKAFEPLIPTEPGVEVHTHWDSGSSGPPSDIQVHLYGEDAPRLRELGDEAARRLRALPEVVDVRTAIEEEGKDEVVLTLDRHAALQYGVTPDAVVATLGAAVRGAQLPRVRSGERETQVTLFLREADRETVDQLKRLTVPSAGGDVPLTALGTLSFQRAPGEIFHRNGRMDFTLTIATTQQDDLEPLRQRIKTVMAGMDFPAGYGYQDGARFRRDNDMMKDVAPGLLLSVVFIFLLMGVLFESWALPIAVLPSIPLSFVGVYWLLFITGTSINPLGILGFVILPGVVVNNAIVLVDRINQMRWEGMTRREAIRNAAQTRLRPILMTALTTIGGLIPMAFGNQELVGMSYRPLGQFFVGGLAVGTVLTLFVVPLFYTYIDDLRFFFMRMLGSAGNMDSDTWRPGIEMASGTPAAPAGMEAPTGPPTLPG